MLENTKVNIGFLGTGLMGAPMARQLQTAGHQVYGWNRSPEKLTPLLTDGIKAAGTPGAVVAATELIVLMLSDAAAIQSTLLNSKTAAHLAHRRAAVRRRGSGRANIRGRRSAAGDSGPVARPSRSGSGRTGGTVRYL